MWSVHLLDAPRVVHAASFLTTCSGVVVKSVNSCQLTASRLDDGWGGVVRGEAMGEALVLASRGVHPWHFHKTDDWYFSNILSHQLAVY